MTAHINTCSDQVLVNFLPRSEVEDDTNYEFLMDFLASFAYDMPNASEIKVPLGKI